MRPKRRNGTEKVVTFGTSSRMTITSSGFSGTSLDVIFVALFFDCCGESLNDIVENISTFFVVCGYDVDGKLMISMWNDVLCFKGAADVLR